MFQSFFDEIKFCLLFEISNVMITENGHTPISNGSLAVECAMVVKGVFFA